MTINIQRISELAERFRRWKARDIEGFCEVCRDSERGSVGGSFACYQMDSRREMRAWVKACRADALGHHRKTGHPVAVQRTFTRKISTGVSR